MKTKFKLSNRILSFVLALIMVLGMMPMTAYAAATEAVDISKKSEYITYSSGAAQYFTYENYLYKATYTNTRVNQIGIAVVGRYLALLSPDLSGIHATLRDANGTWLVPEALPKNQNSSLEGYCGDTRFSTSDGTNRVKFATITLVEVNEPTWNWNDTFSATAKFIAAENADVYATASATISSETVSTAVNCQTKEQVNYTATVTFNGQTYTNTKTEYGDSGPHSYTYSKTSENTVTESCSLCTGHTATATLTATDTNYTGSVITSAVVDFSNKWAGSKEYGEITYA